MISKNHYKLFIGGTFMEIEEQLSEEDVRNMYITPALTKKWNLEKQIRSEVYFTAGRVIVRGNMSTRKIGKKADYILYYIIIILSLLQ